MSTLVRLFLAFFKIGLCSIGGGLATLPFIYELANQSHWFTNQDITTMIGISESTPGAIGINMSTYVGYLVYGVVGGIIATLALMLPSVIIIIWVSKGMQRFKENEYVKCALKGLRSASFALIVVAFLRVVEVSFFQQSIGFYTMLCVIIAIVLFLLIRKYKFHPIFVLFFAAIAGILLQI